MELLAPIVLLVWGLALLTVGGELLVRGATSFARLVGLTPAVIGLTIVAMGTSLPELVVSLIAGMRGQSDIAVGNVVGSNIFNLTAVLGVTAVIITLPVHGSAVRLEWPVMFGASLVVTWAMWNQVLGRAEGIAFLGGLVLFTAYAVYIARNEVAAAENAELEAEVEERSRFARSRLMSLGIVVVGTALLAYGGREFVDGASRLARVLGMEERIIGLTVVGAGTGMPELATSVIAARRKQTDVAVANMIGSNIFNLLAILGVASVVRPITVHPEILRTDVWWMLATTALIYPLLITGMRISRREGALLLGVYVTYIAFLLR
jgi:cation:H+ antiporter